MKVNINDSTFTFRPWRPADGTVFTTPYAFDCETTLIDNERPWITPAYVIGGAFDGRHGYFIRREHVADFFVAHRNVPVVMHNAPFDLSVINLLAPQLGIYSQVDADLVWDTQLLHRGYMLATDGHTAPGKGQSTLDHCADRYLDISLPKDLVDSRGEPVRTSYGQWLNRDPREIEPIYLEYLAKDVVVTHWIFNELRQLLKLTMEQSIDAFGYVSPEWLTGQVHRWGWQTHHIQLKGAIVLKEITANGIAVDSGRRESLDQTLKHAAEERLKALREFGFLPEGPGSQKALQGILRREESRTPGLVLPRTASGKYATSKEALVELSGQLPFVDALVNYKELQKLRSTFLAKMGRSVLHPSFDPFKNSGRTSSFGDINAQNLPRDDKVRSCFVPSPGHVFIGADFSTLELGTLAQAAQSQLNLPSRMAELINQGVDLHRYVASAVANKPENEVTKEERQKAKAINFGKPGGMGNASLQGYAKASYGVDLDDREAEFLSSKWLDMFPEMAAYMSEDRELLYLKVAELFHLTPQNYYDETGCSSFLNHPDNFGKHDQPHPILGEMCLKVMREPGPHTGRGVPYSDRCLEYFWSHVEQEIESLPGNLHSAIRSRSASMQLFNEIRSAIDRGKVYTLTGRLRANASYCTRRNTPFQGLAADGAKLALWLLWRAGFRIVNFIHDEYLIEVPEADDLKHHANFIRELMIEGMKMVVPDVRIDVEYSASKRWYKSAEAVYDEEGRLVPWEPCTPDDEATSTQQTALPVIPQVIDAGPASIPAGITL